VQPQVGPSIARMLPAWLRLGKPDLRVTRAQALPQPTRAAMRTRVRIRGTSSACALLGMRTTEVAAPRPTVFDNSHFTMSNSNFRRHILRPALTALLRQPGSSPETPLDDRGCRSPSMNSLRSQERSWYVVRPRPRAGKFEAPQRKTRGSMRRVRAPGARPPPGRVHQPEIQ
jgi:hypothetical protein